MFAVLHIAEFALQAVLRHEPKLGARPAALFNDSRNQSLVIGMNPAAHEAGVELGMTAPQAVARCPVLLIRTVNSAAETEARATLLAIGFTLSPSIEATAPGICTVDLRGANLSQLEANLIIAIQQLQSFGLVVTAGIARTPLLALYAARSTTNVQWVRNEQEFLSPLPVAAASISPALLGILRQWGIGTLGDLLALPRDAIIRRFGADGLEAWQQASGGSARPITPVIPPQTFSATMEFEDALATLEPLLFILNRLLDRLMLELTSALFVAAEIHLTLVLENETSLWLDFRLPEPTCRTDILFRTLFTRLESLQTKSAIAALTLLLTPVRPLVRQQGIFETGLRDPHGFAETLARLSALVGSDQVGTPQLENICRPDASNLISPFAIIPPPVFTAVPTPMSPPLRRFRPLLPARIELTNGEPRFVWSDYISGEIVDKTPYEGSGELSEETFHWRHNEWDVQLAQGGLYRLVFSKQTWFLAGEYD